MSVQNQNQLPLYLEGEVIQGFGRGSKDLGCPTANIPIEPYEKTLPGTGVYWGFAQVRGSVYPMAMSIGWNPYYKNDKKTIEIHVIHKFTDDFYGEQIRAIALGFIRPEKDFKSLDDLIQAIQEDIETSVKQCQDDKWKKFKEDNWFTK